MKVQVATYEGEFGTSGLIGVYKDLDYALEQCELFKEEYAHLDPTIYIDEIPVE